MTSQQYSRTVDYTVTLTSHNFHWKCLYFPKQSKYVAELSELRTRNLQFQQRFITTLSFKSQHEMETTITHDVAFLVHVWLSLPGKRKFRTKSPVWKKVSRRERSKYFKCNGCLCIKHNIVTYNTSEMSTVWNFELVYLDKLHSQEPVFFNFSSTTVKQKIMKCGNCK
jgi:hypothetical protein